MPFFLRLSSGTGAGSENQKKPNTKLLEMASHTKTWLQPVLECHLITAQSQMKRSMTAAILHASENVCGL